MELVTFQALSAENNNKIDSLDYAIYVYQYMGVGQDFIESLTDVIMPDFAYIDGYLIRKCPVAIKRYHDYLGQGSTLRNAQFFANSMMLTEMFLNCEDEIHDKFSAIISLCWRAYLSKNFPDAIEIVHEFTFDGEDRFITVCREIPNYDDDVSNV